MRFTVAQLGAREHYTVPRALHDLGHLRVLFTDAWVRFGSSAMSFGDGRLRALAHRFHPDLKSAKVIANTPFFAAHMFFQQLAWNTTYTIERQYLQHVKWGKRFTSFVLKHIKRDKMEPGRDVFFGYDTASLEILQYLREKGIFSIVDQIDPAKVEENLVLEENERWPGWSTLQGRIPHEYYERLNREWKLASVVVVNSEWSKEALMKQGVSEKKIVVVPLAYELPKIRGIKTKPPNKILQVLWLGQVNLRKGIQYLYQAANIVKQLPIKFNIVGSLMISPKIAANAPTNMSFIGPVTRDKVATYYSQSDVFILPTLSDGFGITQLEAMAYGLPVIGTPNMGRVVRDGVDGFVVPIRDPIAIADRLEWMVVNRKHLSEMSNNAKQTVKEYSVNSYGQRLIHAVQMHTH